MTIFCVKFIYISWYTSFMILAITIYKFKYKPSSGLSSSLSSSYKYLIICVWVMHRISANKKQQTCNMYNTCQTKLQYSTNLCCLMIFPGRHWRCLVCGNRSPWLPVQQGDLIHHCQTYCWAEMMFHYFRIPKIVVLESRYIL